jgi:predicted O-methyltransferase YrrM
MNDLSVAKPRSYDFSEDWFSANIPLFESFLGDLKGKPCRLLEIGSYEGRSTTWLVENIATHPSATIDAIDAYENPRLQRNLDATGCVNKINLHIAPSAVALRGLPLDAYDFAYIDGNNSTINVLEDAVHAFRLVRGGGVIAFDDYLWDNTDEWTEDGTPKAAIDAFLTFYLKKIILLHQGYQVWIRKKLSAS